ncbi:MAG: hypothetical protein ACE5FN_06345 [Leptospirillia bacterium]
MEFTPTFMALSVGFVILSYGAILLAIWMGYKGIVAKMPPFHEGGHAPGGEGTYDPRYHPEEHPDVPKRGSLKAA